MAIIKHTIRFSEVDSEWLKQQAEARQVAVADVVRDCVMKVKIHDLEISRVENSIESLSGDVGKLRSAVGYLAKSLQSIDEA